MLGGAGARERECEGGGAAHRARVSSARAGAELWDTGGGVDAGTASNRYTVLGRLAGAGGRPRSRTAYLHVNYRSVTPLDRELQVQAAVDRVEGRKIWITAALRDRWTKWAVLGVAAVLFVASLSLVSQLPTQFINAGSEKILQAVVIPPAGASSETVLAQATKAEAIAMDLPDVELVQTSVPGEGDLG